MKIALITNYWKNSDGGGVRTYVTNLVAELQKRKDVRVDVIFREGIDAESYHVPGNKLLFSMKAFWNLIKTKPDAVYTQGSWYCLLSGVLYISLRPKCRLIHTFHTEPERKLSYLGKAFFQCLLNKCDYVTFVSDNLRKINENLLGLRFKNGVIITHAGVNEPDSISNSDLEEFKTTYSISPDSITLLAHGLTSLKGKAEGAKLLIKSLKLLKQEYPNIILILTKEGPFSGELKRFSQLEDVSDNVVFTGNLENPNIPLQICTLYTHITLIEGGVSIALLEAMAMGKPIVATSVGGIPEAIEDGVNGLLVYPDVNLIVQKISYLLENKEVCQMLGKNAKKSAENTFSWSKTADQILKILSESK